MRSAKKTDCLISERWPELKRRAENESDPAKLITIIQEIDDLLFMLDLKFGATKTGDLFAQSNIGSTAYCDGPGAEDEQIPSQ
jgi:hypothetical protein